MLLRQTLLYLPSQLAGPLMQFIFAILWTHWLSQENYGLLTFLIASQELIFVLCMSWWSVFTLRFFGASEGDDAEKFKGAELSVLEIASLPQIVLNIGVLAWLGALHDIRLVIASSVYVVSRSLVVYISERVRTKSNIKLYTIAQTGSLFAGGVLGYLLVRYYEASAISVFAGFAAAHLFVALWLVRHLGIGVTPRAFDPTLFRKAFVFGLPLIAAGVVNWINLNGIRVITEHFAGEVAVGLLAVGWGLGQRLSGTVAMFVTTAAFPLAAKKLATTSREAALTQLGYGGTLLVGIIVPAAIGLWVITPPFVSLFISEPFRDMTLTIMPLAVATGAVRNIRVHYADMAFILFERTELTILVNVVEAVAMIAFCIIGLKMNGLPGAVTGAFAASAIAVLFGFVVARRWFGLHIPLLDWGRILAASVTMAAVLMSLATLFARLPLGGQIVAQALLGSCVYLAALAALFPVRTRAVLQEAWDAQSARSSARSNIPDTRQPSSIEDGDARHMEAK